MAIPDIGSHGHRLLFPNALGASQLGTRHSSLDSYSDAVYRCRKSNGHDIPTEFSLVVLLSSDYHQRQQRNISILLGKKLRGFGKGFYNCFGGKLEKGLGECKHPAKGAVREVQEETGIQVPLQVMEDRYVGTLNFTFEDSEVNKAMKVYLYCLFLSFNGSKELNDHDLNDGTAEVMISRDIIRGCDEIEPIWFTNIYDIPLQQMFADDSLWLVMLLRHYDDVFDSNENSSISTRKFMFDGWFHFESGGAETNSISHYHIKTNQSNEFLCTTSPPKLVQTKYTLEKQLFHALHLNHINNPSIKEFKESWAMVNAVRRFMGDGARMQYVIDVAGGHGALAALFLVLEKKCYRATVIDPAIVKGKYGVQEAWSPFWKSNSSNKELVYRHECLRTALRDELETIFNTTQHSLSSTNVLVIACHACQHLTDETMQIASEFGVNVACMPCCQKDHDGWWKRSAKEMGLSIGAMIDVLSAGRMMAWETGAKADVKYQVKMKFIDKQISPLQNRIILCKAMHRCENVEDTKTKVAHKKLTKAYHRAHKRNTEDNQGKNTNEDSALAHGGTIKNNDSSIIFGHPVSLLTGFCLGIIFSLFITSSNPRKS